MPDTLPAFNIHEVERFCFPLYCIYKGKTKPRVAILKMLEKFVRPANENFTMFCNKVVYESWRTLFSILVLKKLKAFAFICTVSIRGKLNSNPLYIKTLEKFVQPANENFKTFWQKTRIYELWWKSFPTLVSKKLKAFAFICIVFISGRLNSAQKICSTRK